MVSPDRAVAVRAARQHGLVSAAQLRALGLDHRAVGRRVCAGRLHPVHAGPFAVGHPCLTESGRLLAAVLAYGAGAAISHRSAASHWLLLPRHPGPVDVIAEASHQRRGTHRHRLALDPTDVIDRDGVPTTRPGRTLADLATQVPQPVLGRAVHEAQVRLLPQNQIAGAVALAKNRRGAEALRALLAEIEPTHRLRSELERRFLVLITAANLPSPQTNLLVEFEGRLHELDVAWPDRHVAIELDGEGSHRTAAAWEAAHDRDARIRRNGWQAQRFTGAADHPRAR